MTSMTLLSSAQQLLDASRTVLAESLQRGTQNVASAVDAVDALIARLVPAYASSNSRVAAAARVAVRIGLRVVAAGAATSAASWIMCYFRAYPANLFYQVHYGLSHVIGWSSCAVAVAPVYISYRLGLATRARLRDWTLRCAHWTNSWIFLCNPQIRFVVVRGLAEQRKNADGTIDTTAPPTQLSDVTFDSLKSPGGLTLNCNHTSQLDGFVMNWCTPGAATFSRCRYMGKEEVFKTPIFGQLCEACDFFKVYYRSDSSRVGEKAYDDWGLDKEKQAAEMEKVKTFLAEEGGIFCFATEGRITKDPSLGVQSPRRGMLAILFAAARPIYTVTMWPAFQCWPAKAAFPVGGLPATITLSISRYEFPSKEVLLAAAAAKAAASSPDGGAPATPTASPAASPTTPASPAAGGEGGALAEALSDALRAEMQRQLDHVQAEHAKLHPKKK
jgi:1-acyl-sn-glycerol-3-phosphate acyltransferase